MSQHKYNTEQHLFWFVYDIAAYSEPGILSSKALFIFYNLENWKSLFQ